MTFADCASPSQREVLLSLSRTGRPLANCCSSMSASIFESANAGIGGIPSAQRCAPVCGVRETEVPADRITIATAPSFAASAAPEPRGDTVLP